MTPDYINSSQSPFHGGSNGDHDHQKQHFFGPTLGGSSSSYSCHFYFNSTQDQDGYYPSHELYQPQEQFEGNDHAAYGGSYEVETKVGNGKKLSLGNKEAKIHGDHSQKNTPKWMSSKMRLMKKMKSTDFKDNVEITNNTTVKRDDQKQTSSSMETDNSSYCSSNINSTTPVRVCADCNTTKTPLWRSGPKGPKSLCNACGIRQRKARRALAAAAAAATANGQPVAAEAPTTVKIKNPPKEKFNKNNHHNLTVPFKKRCKVAAAAGSSHHHHQEPKKIGRFEEYLIKMSKNLPFHHVFPQDEKEAAILLMALSCGLVHG